MAFWLVLDASFRTALGCVAFATLASIASAVAVAVSSTNEYAVTNLTESDLPIAEDGVDLLGRREIIDGLVSRILLEQPSVIALTGAYGDGKTSLLNLTVGKLKTLQETTRPVIVRFSPWLAGDSNTLVLSLLDSIVAEIKSRFFVPGLGRDATRYARTLLSIIPKVESLRNLISEKSQEQRIIALAQRIARTRQKILVVLDDLDRMRVDELETVFKILRGSDRLSNITFLCSFDKDEVGLILKSEMPNQDTARFIEKFFQVQVSIPRLESRERRSIFSQKITAVIDRYDLQDEALPKQLESIWEQGGEGYFQNLRRIKLFSNKLGLSLKQIGAEVNCIDLIRLELIRDVLPNVYKQIYLRPEYFYRGDFAFETSFQGLGLLEKDKAKKERAAFYEKLKVDVPDDRQYAFAILEGLFPDYAIYRDITGEGRVSAEEAEKTKRIFHPRCFRQYFTLKVPTELFSWRDLTTFIASVRDLEDDGAAKSFTREFQLIKSEEFKRWHFMHLLEKRFDEFKIAASRGLCRGMAQNSGNWQHDAFELLIAIRVTKTTLMKIDDKEDRLSFLRAIVSESESFFYTLTLLLRLEKGFQPEPFELAHDQQFKALGFPSDDLTKNNQFISEIATTKNDLKARLRRRYLSAEAPSVFEEFGSLSQGRMEPISFLLSWRYLGADAESDEHDYLETLFSGSPSSLDAFLNLMFRVEFLYENDYSAYKSLIDYSVLSGLIDSHEKSLDSAKVRAFRTRFKKDQPQ